MKKSSALALLMMVMLTCLTLFACGGGDDDDEDAEDPTTTEEATGGGDTDGGDEPTATSQPLSGDGYMTEFTRITEGMIAIQEDLESDFAAATEDEDLDAANQSYRELVGSYDEALESLAALTPPPELQDAHEDFLSALGRVRDFDNETADIVSEAETWQDAVDGAAGRTSEVYDELRTACDNLAGVADDTFDITDDPSCNL